MDRNELQKEQSSTMNEGANINLILNGQDSGNIDLGRVIHNMRIMSRIYIWVLILCLVAGLCIPLLIYQFTKPLLTVFSAVTLTYEVDNDEAILEKDPDAPERIMVQDLTAPDGEELDLNLITSSYVLQNALNGLELSQPVTLSNLRSNIKIERILTEESTRQQEVLSAMLENKSSDAYKQMSEAEYSYTNTFIVSLVNGFGDEDSRVKLELKENELRILLDRILISYNEYLVKTYADKKLPDDAISIIDLESQDIPDNVDQLRSALNNLYNYCDEKPEEVKTYRSWQTGYTLLDLMNEIQMIQEVDVEYLLAYVYANGIARDRETAIDGLWYEKLVAETELEEIRQNIAAGKALLDSYKNDEILVSVTENETLKTAQTNTEYYNKLILQQAENEKKAAEKQEEIAEITDRIAALNNAGDVAADGQLEEAEEELARVAVVCQSLNQWVRDHMEEIFSSTFYNTMASHSVALGKVQNFLEASAKKMLIGLIAGGILGCAIWFIAGLIPEFARRRQNDEETTDDENSTEQEVDAQ